MLFTKKVSEIPIACDCSSTTTSSQTSQTLLRRRLIFFHHHHPPHTTLTAFFIGSPQSPSHIWYLGNPHCGFLLLLSIVWVDAAEVVVNAGSEGKEHFHRPLRKGAKRILAPPHPHSTWLRHVFIELRSPSDLAIHMPFSSWCWGSSGGWVGDGFGICLVSVSPCFSILLSPCLFHWPCQLSIAYTVNFPSGLAIRVLRSWSWN